MKAGILLGAMMAALLGAPLARAQRAARPPAATAQPPSASQAAQAPAAQTPGAAAGGRRDPFHTLIVKKVEEKMPTRLPPGKKGLLIGQIQVQGIVRGIDGEWIAVVDNKTKRSYFLHEKDEVYNGVVSKISADSIVFQENVTDAMGRSRVREVVKQLLAE